MSFLAVLKSVRSQWTPLPCPTASFKGQTIIVTGANAGLGLEASRTFVRLGAARVILAVRSLSKGAAALSSIESSTNHPGTCEVWELDIGDFESVKRFIKRAEGLDRLDVVCANAGVAGFGYRENEHDNGFEGMTAINVVGTFLLVVGLVGVLRRSGERWNVCGRMEITSSGNHEGAKFHEQHTPNIFDSLALNNNPEWTKERYPVTKLMQVLLARELAEHLSPKKSKIAINVVNPGFCKSELARDAKGMMKVIFSTMKFFLARSTEMGSRTVVAAAVEGAGENEKDGWMYMSDCVKADPSAFVMSEEGKKAGEKLWDELAVILEGLQPGIISGL